MEAATHPSRRSALGSRSRGLFRVPVIIRSSPAAQMCVPVSTAHPPDCRRSHRHECCVLARAHSSRHSPAGQRDVCPGCIQYRRRPSHHALPVLRACWWARVGAHLIVDSPRVTLSVGACGQSARAAGGSRGGGQQPWAATTAPPRRSASRTGRSPRCVRARRGGGAARAHARACALARARERRSGRWACVRACVCACVPLPTLTSSAQATYPGGRQGVPAPLLFRRPSLTRARYAHTHAPRGARALWRSEGRRRQRRRALRGLGRLRARQQGGDQPPHHRARAQASGRRGSARAAGSQRPGGKT